MRRNGRFAALAAAACVGIASPAFGQLRYVAAGGSDTGDCISTASPCATLAYASSRAQSGDTLRIETDKLGVPVRMKGVLRLLRDGSPAGRLTVKVKG